MSRGRFAFPIDSSASPSTKLRAEASGIVRNARKKLLACRMKKLNQICYAIKVKVKVKGRNKNKGKGEDKDKSDIY